MTDITEDARDAITRAADLVSASLRNGGTLFVAGNGGSFADALHIAGELAKDFERPRPLPSDVRDRLAAIPGGAELAACLQQGVRVIVLGTNPTLVTAVDNDLALRHAGFAQELCALARPHDVLLAVSTSGQSPSLVNAAVTARALEVHVVGLLGPNGGPVAELAEVAICAPGSSTADIQTAQVAHYHLLCRLIEDALFPS